jgi:hypothetical protein
MKTQCSAALTSFLDELCTAGVGGEYCVIDLYTIYLQSGVALRWAAWPIPISFPSTGIYGAGSVGGNTRVAGQTYSASGPYLDRSRITQALKLEVSQVKVTIRANPTMTIGSTPILAAISSGMFAGATVYVDRLWAQTYFPFDFTLGTLNWFTGQVAEVEKVTRAMAVLSVKDPTALLGAEWPRNQYLTGCTHTFGDAGCVFSKAGVTQAGAVQAGSTTTVIKTNLTQTDVIPAPTAAPALSATGDNLDINIASQTYYVVVTFTGPNGESAASSEASLAVTGSTQTGANGTTDKLLIVSAPPSPPSSATGWNVYVATGSGDEQLQASFTGFSGSSAHWTQIGSLAQGAPAPSLGTLGYFSQGIISFTSGANAGLSQVVQSYALVGGLGVVTTAPPLPSTPAAGDTFTIVPDCDKSIARCSAYGNLAHCKGFPFIPAPEQSV